MSLTRRCAIGISIIIVGALPYLYALLRLHQHNWTPLSYPIQLKPGIIVSPYFTTDLNGTYMASIEYDDESNSEKNLCMIGFDQPKGSCRDVTRTLYFSWEIVSDSQRPIESGTFDPTTIGIPVNNFVWFEGKRGRRQKIVLYVSKDAGELNAAHPRIQVEAHFSYWENWVLLEQLGFFLLIVVCLPALVWTVWPLIRRRGISRGSLQV